MLEASKKSLKTNKLQKKMKQKKAKMARACKKLMCFRPDLLGPSEKSIPAVSTPKPVRKTRETLVTSRKKIK